MGFASCIGSGLGSGLGSGGASGFGAGRGTNREVVKVPRFFSCAAAFAAAAAASGLRLGLWYKFQNFKIAHNYYSATVGQAFLPVHSSNSGFRSRTGLTTPRGCPGGPGNACPTSEL